MEDLVLSFRVKAPPGLHFLGLDDTHSDQDSNFVLIPPHINRLQSH